MKNITLILMVLTLIITSCDKNDDFETFDPFLTWKIGFDYNENWDVKACFSDMICICPKVYNEALNYSAEITRQTVHELSLSEFADEQKYTNTPTNSGSVQVNNIEFLFYNYKDTAELGDMYFIDRYFFIVDRIGYDLIFKVIGEDLYDDKFDEFTDLLNSIYVK